MTSTATPLHNPQGNSTERSGRVKRRVGRLGILVALVTVLSMTAAGAATGDAFNANLHNKTYTWSNCSIRVGFVQDNHDGARWGSIAGSYMNCSTQHTFVVQQQLTFNGVVQPGYTQVLRGTGTSFASVASGGLLETAPRCATGTWGSILVMSLDGSIYYSMSNAPQYVPTAC